MRGSLETRGKRLFWYAMAVALGLMALNSGAYANLLSIYDIQFNTSDGDASIYNGQIHDVVGGIVTHTWAGFNDRVYLRDPAHPTWGAICVKDWEGDLISNVQIGDWVSFTDIYIEEYRGGTFLQWNREAEEPEQPLSPDAMFTIESSGNEVPDPTLLTAADLIVPVNHAASEPYEHMVVTLEEVTVGTMDLGKNEDNYELIDGTGIAWGTDYMNIDAGGPYDPHIVPGAFLDSITGIVDQYTKLPSWDYYQLATRSAADVVPEPGTLTLLLPGLLLTAVRRRRG